MESTQVRQIYRRVSSSLTPYRLVPGPLPQPSTPGTQIRMDQLWPMRKKTQPLEAAACSRFPDKPRGSSIKMSRGSLVAVPSTPAHQSGSRSHQGSPKNFELPMHPRHSLKIDAPSILTRRRPRLHRPKAAAQPPRGSNHSRPGVYDDARADQNRPSRCWSKNGCGGCPRHSTHPQPALELRMRSDSNLYSNIVEV